MRRFHKGLLVRSGFYFRRQYSSNQATSNVNVVIALGSNVGDSVQIFQDSLLHLSKLGTLLDTSFLYESKPMYFIDQPSFLNAACLLQTKLSAIQLISELKKIETTVGRRETFQNGPRVIDLDIVFYGSECIKMGSSSDSKYPLVVPHERMHERAFVVKPVLDMLPNHLHPKLTKSISQLWAELPPSEQSSSQRVLPAGRLHNGSRRLLPLNVPFYICGILNVTPDSFSDGGNLGSGPDMVVNRAHKLISDGASLLDIGGESTRPGASPVMLEEELRRVIPAIQAIRAAGLDCPISVDTRHSVVASAAIKAGAGIINDVSGGTHDPDMIPLSQSACVPMIYMHMRGSPQTMTQPEYCNYSNPPADVARELALQLEAGCSTGIPRWMQMVDPGFGFAKQADICQDLLRPKNLRLLRQLLKDRPVMIGLSRKRFLETMLLKAPTYASQTSISATERDSATVGGCIAALLSGSSPDREALSSLILRVHNVKATHDACVVLTKLIS